MSRQRLGQHFLADDAWRAQIAATLSDSVAQGDPAVWVEIGAGHGEMTEYLARRARRVLAIETDSRLAHELRDRARLWSGVEVVAADVLTLDLAQLAGRRFHVYGNLPYYITSPILHHLFAFAEQIATIDIVIQFEVAARIVARPGRRDFGYLSALCQFYARPEITLRIPPGAFRPPPKVASALVHMQLPGERASLGIREEVAFLKFIQKCFEQKRKTLRNNLRAAALVRNQAPIEAALDACKIRPDARAEQLTLRQFADLFTLLTRG
jgi:16S rRNA (adenine1518-N6/adenine1519-N6)-dimethyltransferase